MLDELLKYDYLGNKNELSFLLLKALPLSKRQKVSDMRAYCTSNHYTIGRSLEGILKLLEFMELITVYDGMMVVADSFFNEIKNSDGEWDHSSFAKNMLLALKDRGGLQYFITSDAIRFDTDDGIIYVRENWIPFQFFGIRNLLISLGFFERNLLIRPNMLTVNGEYRDFFLSEIVESMKEIVQNKRKQSLQQLKAKIVAQEVLGKNAELFVVDFEKARLGGHLLIDMVQRISEDYGNAGYDIESFNEKNSVFLDRFIEVKSYSERIEFFWSENEVEVAKELQEKYYLYLVDRSKISLQGYSPAIFQNPYQTVFDNNFWLKQPQSWKFVFQEEP